MGKGNAKGAGMVQMSVASSTNTSQTATLAHDQMTPMHANQDADYYGDNMETLRDDPWNTCKCEASAKIGLILTVFANFGRF